MFIKNAIIDVWSSPKYVSGAAFFQLAFTSSKLEIETLQQGMEYVQS